MNKIKLDIQKFAVSVGAYKKLSTQGGSSNVYCIVILQEVDAAARKITFWMRLLCTWTGEPFEDYRVKRGWDVWDNDDWIDGDADDSKWPNSSDDWKSETRSVGGTSYKQYCQYYKKEYTFDNAAHTVQCDFDFDLDGSASYLPTASAYNISTVVTLPAVSRNITYNANGGSSTPAAQTGGVGSTVTLAGAISRNSSDSTGTISVSYNANGGSGGPSSASTGTYVNRTTYTFTGWLSSATSQTYSGGASYTVPDSDSTMTAQWSSSTSRYSNPSITLSSTTPTRAGYNFLGWSTSSTATSASYSPNTAYTFSANTALYAVWSKITYTNSIAHWTWGYQYGEGNNAAHTAYSIGTTTFTAQYGSTYTLDTNRAITIPNGFYLVSTFGTSSISGTWANYNMGTQVTQTSAAMSYEYDYRPYSYTITYNLDGGINNPSNPSTYNVLYGVTFLTPTKSRYNFVGWKINNTFVTGINPGANASFTSIQDLYDKCAARTTGNITVTAVWELAQAQVDQKVNNTWVRGDLFIKKNGEWVPGIVVYKKINGVWVQGIN